MLPPTRLLRLRFGHIQGRKRKLGGDLSILVIRLLAMSLVNGDPHRQVSLVNNVEFAIEGCLAAHLAVDGSSVRTVFVSELYFAD